MRLRSYSAVLALAALSVSLAWLAPEVRAETPRAIVFGSAMAVGTEVLAGQRGGTEVQIRNENWVDGTVQGNQANNVQTGSNLIGGGSFAGAVGIVNAVQNSGNNVLVQSATIINVQVR